MDETDSLFNAKEKAIPRLNQCFICGKWTIEGILHPVEIPSQGTEYVKKLICPSCMLPISVDMQRLEKEAENA
ncbi:MAG: hypothetical protein ACLQGU_17765 [bacterium]